MNEDPVYREFFAPEEGYAAAVVRESIQNSLDASDQSGNAVRVVFTLAARADDSAEDSRYFSGLLPHLRAQGLSTLPGNEVGVPFLSIEDFNTRGLKGDPAQDMDLGDSAPPSERNDFYYFWRNVGRSRKSATDRGRWGLGKTVYPASSNLNAFYGLTIRSADNRRLLLGQSVGKIHTIEEGERTKYDAYGYFGEFADDGFALPVDQPTVIADFTEYFHLTRVDEPGLSIVVPFPIVEIRLQDLLREVIRNWYVPVLKRGLVVVVRDQKAAFQVDAESIEGLVEQVEWKTASARSEIKDVLAFARRAVAFPETDWVTLKAAGEASAPVLGEALFTDTDLAQLRADFEAGKLQGFQIPVVVRKAGQQKMSYMRALVQYDENLQAGNAEFVRQGLAISQVNKPPRRTVRGLLLVDDPALSTLLGDSENPAHTKWQERSEKIRAPDYTYGSSTVRFVVSSLQRLVELLSQQAQGEERDLLIDLFYLDRPDQPAEPKKAPTSTRTEQGETPAPEPPEEPKQRAFRIDQIEQGCRIVGNGGAKNQPEALRVELAYGVRAGNAFQRYLPFDFILEKEPIVITHSGVRVRAVKYNRLEVDIIDAAFWIELRGFDPHRDLVVKARAIAAGDEE